MANATWADVVIKVLDKPSIQTFFLCAIVLVYVVPMAVNTWNTTRLAEAVTAAIERQCMPHNR